MVRAFYYDIVCPYAYMAFSYLRRFDVFKKHHIELRPILLGGLFKQLGHEPDPNKSMSKLKANYLHSDIERQARFFDVVLNHHPRHPVSTVKAMRLIHACDEGEREAFTEHLYRAYWQENLDIDDDETLQVIAKQFGIKDNSDKAKQHLIDATNEAFLAKVFGVPTILFNDRLYFGSDRLVLIRNELDLPWPDASWRAGSTLDFYFDFSSPYSYLAWGEMKNAIGAGVSVKLKPVLLGALFKEIGMTNIPMLSAHPNKTAYYMQDMKDWAAYRNMEFTFSSHFPLRTVTALRIALLEPEVVDVIFKSAWSLNVDVGDKETLCRLLKHAGFNGDRLMVEAEEEHIKNLLKDNTQEALRRGVFGLPTIFFNQHQIFGQDRFSFMRRVVQGL